MSSLYKFYWDCGRQGSLEGVFTAEPEEIKRKIGQHVNFGEALGKHSEIYGTIDEGDITLLTDDQDFIAKAREFGLVPMGYNPLEYMEDE